MVIRLILALFNLLQPGITDTEVMGYFMFYYLLYFGDDFVIIIAHGLNRLLEYGYFVRRHHAVVTVPIGQRYALIEAEEGMTAPEPRLPQLSRRRLVFHHHINIVQPGSELIRQRFNRRGHKFLKPSLIHYFNPTILPVFAGSDVPEARPWRLPQRR